MKTIFYTSEFKNISSIVLENDNFRLEWLPSYGAKLASLQLKKSYERHELLYQSPLKQLVIPNYGDIFSEYDSSGFDECFPSIDPCILATEGTRALIVPDHGEVWAMPWVYTQVDESTLRFAVTSDEFGYTLVKTIHLHADGFNCDYSLSLDEKTPLLPFLWAPHALFIYDDDTRIIIPERMNRIINVCPQGGFLGNYGDIHNYPMAKKSLNQEFDLSLFEVSNESSCEKFYFEQTLGRDELFGFENASYKILLSVDETVSPYLGIWKNQGAFGQHHNFALEPCSGIYDSIQSAFHNKTCAVATNLVPTSWYFNIKIMPK
jgi:galactose mutarotase-like enzyme